MSEKVYINGVFIKESKYGLKLNINADKFCQQIKELANDKGYVIIDLLPRKEKGQYGDTHYAVLDTWKPTEKQEVKQAKETESDGLPF